MRQLTRFEGIHSENETNIVSRKLNGSFVFSERRDFFSKGGQYASHKLC